MPTTSQPSNQTKKVDFHLIFLPGLHGTAELFGDLVDQLTTLGLSFQTTLISYPPHHNQSYKKLLKWLYAHLNLGSQNSDSKTVIIAESFSTPLALKLADKFPQQINALVIGGGFCASPANPAFSLFPLRPLFILSPPRSTLRHFLTGPESSSELVDKVRATIKNVSSKILSQRIRSVLTLEEEQVPIIPEIPILLLQAEHDAIIPWEIQNQLEQHLPHAQIHWLNSPHLIFQAHPKTCASHITNFLLHTKS